LPPKGRLYGDQKVAVKKRSPKQAVEEPVNPRLLSGEMNEHPKRQDFKKHSGQHKQPEKVDGNSAQHQAEQVEANTNS
jgi:hypothetical protein